MCGGCFSRRAKQGALGNISHFPLRSAEVLSPWRSSRPLHEGTKSLSLTSLTPTYAYAAFTQYFSLSFFLPTFSLIFFLQGSQYLCVGDCELSVRARSRDLLVSSAVPLNEITHNPWKSQRLFHTCFQNKRRQRSRRSISSLRATTSAAARQHHSDGPGKLLLLRRSRYFCFFPPLFPFLPMLSVTAFSRLWL